jgi:lipopolysaccharide exporter
MTEGVGGRTVRGVRITFGATVLSGLIQAGVLVVMARLLTPLDYGLVTGSLVVVRPVQLILFAGLERAVILDQDLSHQRTASIMSLNVLLGLGATLIVAALAGLAWLSPPFHRFAPTLLALSPALLITGLGVTPRAILRQRLAYGRLATADVVSQLLGQVLMAIAAARAGLGAYSLVLGYLTQSVIQMVMNLQGAATRPTLRMAWSVVSPILKFSFSISKTSLLELLSGQIPALSVGGVLGPISLGVYNRAYSLIQLPVEMLANSMSRVLFSGFSLVREDVERLRRGCRGLIEIGSAAVIPVCCGMAAAASDLVPVLLGPKWSSTEVIIPWICVGATCGLVAHLFAVMSEAAVRLEARFRLQLVATVATAVAFAVGVRFGLVGCSAAFAFGNVVFLIGNVWLTSHILRLSLQDVLRWIQPAAVSGGCMILYVTLIRATLTGALPAVRLIVEIAGCAIVLAALYLLFWPRTVADVARYSGLPLPWRRLRARVPA